MTTVSTTATQSAIIHVQVASAAGQGVSVPAYRLAKLKTVAQQLAVALALFPVTAADATWTWMIALWVAVVLTVVTGIHYFVTARRTAEAQAPA